MSGILEIVVVVAFAAIVFVAMGWGYERAPTLVEIAVGAFAIIMIYGLLIRPLFDFFKSKFKS
jgi:hypothetical protein